MKTAKRIFVKTGLLAAGAMLALMDLAPYAQAAPVQIGFNGAVGSGHVSLNVGPDTLPTNPSPPAGSSDPLGAQLVTGASGTFTDASGTVQITGVLARNFALPFDMEPGGSFWSATNPTPFPASFSQLAAIGGTGNVVTYSDLFYAGGSPQSCWDYPFAGGLLDTYGVMFTLSDGRFVDLWSDGSIFVPNMSPVSLTYGLAVISPANVLNGFQFGGVHAAVPEPNFLWLFGAGLLGLFAWRRSVEMHKPAHQST